MTSSAEVHPAVAAARKVRGMLKTEQAAEILGVCEKTLRRWRDESAGPRFIRIGRKVFYRPEDVDAWLEAQTVET